jgi:predicted esterase
MEPLFRFSLLFIGCLLMLDGHSIHARGDEPAKPKKFANAWVPEGKPLRGILHFDGRQAGNPKPWQPFCEHHGLVWFPHEGGDILQEKLLAEIAAELKHPELINAPVIRVGLSSNGGSTILLAHQHPDRMLAGVTHQPLPPFAKGNEGFNFNRINEKGNLEGTVHDISQSFRVPCILQAGENDPVCGTIMAYGLAHYARSQKAPWTYFCLPRGGHGNVVPNELLMAWLDGVIAQRLPADVDLSKGPPKLNDIRIEAGWLANPHTLEIAEFAKYDGDKSKATWLPNEASALAWKKLGVAMPFALPEQSVRMPSGLIDKLVIHDPKSNRVVPSDSVYGEPWKIIANLKPGDVGWKVQRNCSVPVIGKVPELVRGCDWIKPDNASLAFAGEVLMEFTVTDKATVFVAHDERLAKKPAWLADWKDTGESLQGGFLGNERSFRIFAKEFPKGETVKLGPNGPKLETREKSKLEPWIYLTIVKHGKQG